MVPWSMNLQPHRVLRGRVRLPGRVGRSRGPSRGRTPSNEANSLKLWREMLDGARGRLLLISVGMGMIGFGLAVLIALSARP